MNNLIWTAAVLLLLYLGLVVLVYLNQEKLIWFPDSTIHATPEEVGLAYEDLTCTTSDGVDIHGWFVPAPEAELTLLFFHGNGGNISGRLETLRQFHDMGLNMFMIDYRGYGRSDGSPTEEGTYRDAEAAWDCLVERKGIVPDSIIIMGRSLGGAIAAWLAGEKQPRALILESTFPSAVAMAREAYPFLPVNLLLRHRYPTSDHIRDLRIPKLIAASRDDDIVPWHLGRAVYDSAPEPKTFLELRGLHNSISRGGPYEKAVREFIFRHSPDQ